MSSKSPKTELVSKNSLPKTPAQLKAESSSSVVAASSASTSTTMKSSTAVSSNLMTKIQADQVISSSIGANGFSEGSNFYDSLSLKQLNDLLLFYIQRVHEMEKDLVNVSFIYFEILSFGNFRVEDQAVKKLL